jgi:hypothetical protein
VTESAAALPISDLPPPDAAAQSVDAAADPVEPRASSVDVTESSLDVAGSLDPEPQDAGSDHASAFSAAMEAMVCHQVLGSRRHGL